MYLSNQPYGEGVSEFIKANAPAEIKLGGETAKAFSELIGYDLDYCKLTYSTKIEDGEVIYEAYIENRNSIGGKMLDILCMALKVPVKHSVKLPEPLVFLPVPEWVASEGYDGITSALDFPSILTKQAEEYLAQLTHAVKAMNDGV